MLLGKHVWNTFWVSVIEGEIFFLVNQSPSWIVWETNIAGSADMVWKVQEETESIAETESKWAEITEDS